MFVSEVFTAGFDNETLFAINADFSGSAAAEEFNGLFVNGDLWIGSTAVNAGGTHVNVGTLVAGPGITIGYVSPNITISSSGGAASIDSVALQTGTSPIAPDGTGLITFNGAVVAAGTNPVRTNGTGPNTMALQVQISQAIAGTNATNIGLAAFNSAQFTVDANGFVSTAGAGIATTLTGDSGGALSPSGGNFNILGGPGVTTSGSGSTLTINAVVFTDTTATTLVRDNGYFATAAGTYVLPASPTQGEIVIIDCDTAGAVVVDAPGTQLIRIGSGVSAAGGTATSNAIGDSLTLRYRASNTTWHAVDVVGTWTLV